MGYAVVDLDVSSLSVRRACLILHPYMRVWIPHWILEYPKIICFILILKDFKYVKVSILNIIIRILNITTVLENNKLGHAIKLLIWKKNRYSIILRGCSYGSKLARLGRLAHLCEISPFWRNSFKKFSVFIWEVSQPA